MNDVLLSLDGKKLYNMVRWDFELREWEIVVYRVTWAEAIIHRRYNPEQATVLMSWRGFTR